MKNVYNAVVIFLNTDSFILKLVSHWEVVNPFISNYIWQ